MKKIGVIDYYLDQYHFENYPGWIREASGGTMEIAYAWAKTEHTGGKSNTECCAEQGVELLSSMEEVIEKSDCLIVMSPDNPEMHEELCSLALGSGKPTYVDKTFAVSRQAAQNLIEMARKGNTPFFSTSALRYSREYRNVEKEGIEAVASRGPGMFGNYGIHQLEPIICMMGAGVEKIMYVGAKDTPCFVLRYSDGRFATMTQLGWECDFGVAINYKGDHARVIQGASDFYQQFIGELVGFFEDGIPRVPAEETLQIITILEYGHKAMEQPDTWVKLPG
ncbi:MAG: Gfo/Idh/MocA family oxidoreductase [Acetatifactor sp.]|nr:Gfo/Idh/MocA family oxidoreductase [Acetatifactor sp.]